MRHLKLSVLTLVAASLAAPVFADGHAAALEAATKARKANMSTIGYHTGILGAMAKGDTPYDAAVATAAAENLSAAASMNRIVLWIEGSEQGAVPGSRAKTEIWSDAAGFEEDAVALETAAAAMVAAAGTDLDSLRAAMGAVGAACGDCHKAYRGPSN
ncbi:cytochrome c [uncultured Tateyamaria sp.]|uniref:c-type cytochrome n=1 Tax=uncultured Tateyamaria sp. TaxID=455651 RepID=UPI00260CF2F0|nr:cytochrome c [uncultured Tateyamaria sp.]